MEQDKVSQEEIDELFDDAEALKDEVVEYRSKANWVQNAFLRRDEGNDTYPGDYPYAEDLERTSGLAKELDEVSRELNRFDADTMSEEQTELFYELGEVVSNARATLEDCSEVPDDDDDNEDDHEDDFCF